VDGNLAHTPCSHRVTAASRIQAEVVAAEAAVAVGVAVVEEA